jgi:hypothetical protein
MSKFSKIILVIIILILAGGFFILILKNNQAKQTQLSEKDLEYRNVTRNFSLRYPKELAVKEYDEGDTTYTIVFTGKTNTDISTSSTPESFQIFFTPYMDNVITKSRILKDVPSGQFTDPIEVIIGDGTHALAFFSKTELGETREVWFIHDGYLFEVTAYKELDSWLAEIMKSWQFLPMSAAGN